MIIKRFLAVMSESRRHALPHLGVQPDVSLRPRFPLLLWHVAELAVRRGRVGALRGQRSPCIAAQCLRGGAEGQHLLCGVLLPASRTLPGLASNAFWVLLARSTRPLRFQKLAHVHQIALQSPGCSSSAKGSGHTPAARDAADANQLLAAITTINNWCLGSQLAAVTLCVSCTSSASRTLSARNT